MTRYLNQGGVIISSLSLLVITFIGGIDMMGHQVLGMPLPGMLEVTETLMATLVFFAFATLQAKGRNISMDFLFARANMSTQRILRVLANFLGLAFFTLMAWGAWSMAWYSLGIREYSQGVPWLPIYPSKFAFALGITLMVIQYLVDLLSPKRTKSAVPPIVHDGEEKLKGRVQI